MCKLSQNIVPNVYNSLQSSFLSLAWPWPGRSFPKGNQWEWWDPGKGPLPGLGEVGHSPRGTSGSAGTLNWGPMWSGSQSTCCPNASLTLLHPLTPDYPMLPNGPQHPWVPQFPLLPPIPLLALSTNTPSQPCIHPWQPLHPLTPLIGPTLTRNPNAPLCHLDPSGPWVPTLPASPHTPLHHLTPHNGPNTP